MGKQIRRGGLCKRHILQHLSEIAQWNDRARDFPGDLSSLNHPAWGKSEAEETLKWAQSQNFCVDCAEERG